MNLNLSKFKKISEDNASATLRHPDGHEIRISKKILSKDTHQELQKLPLHLAEGTPNAPVEEPNASYDPGVMIAEAPAPVAEEKAPSLDDLYNQKLQEKLKAVQMMGHKLSDPDPTAPYGKSYEVGAEESTLRELEAARKNEQEASARLQKQHQNDLDLLKSQNERRARLGLSVPLGANENSVADASTPFASNALEAPSAPATAMPAGPQTQIEGPETLVTSKGPILQADLHKPYDTAMAGVQNQLQAAEGLGRVEAAQQKQNADLYQKNIEAQQAEQTRARQIFDTLNQEHNAFMQDYKNQHIDPRHYLNSMGTGQKIATTMGLILGGIGGAFTHQGNTAEKFLNQQIQNDMDSQKAEMGKKENLLAANFKQFGNMKQAEDMYQAQTKSILADQILQQANKSGSQAAMLNAQNTAGKLQWEASQHLQNIAFQQMAQEQMLKTSASGNPSDNIPQLINSYRMAGREELAKSLEQKYIPNVGLAKVPVPESVRTQIQTRQNLDNKVNELIKFTKENQGTVWNRAKVAQGEAMVNLLTDAYRQANQQGVFKESEKNFVGSFLKQDPTAFFAKFRTLPGYNQVHKDNLNTLNSLKNSVGLPTTFVPSSAQAYKGR